MLMVLMHILSKRFWAARFRDVLIESSVIVGGSIKPCQERCTIQVFGCINWLMKHS